MGKNKHSICHCDYCVEGRIKRKGMNDVDDYEDLVPYRKKTRRSRKNKACKKSKTGEACDFSVKKVYRSYNHYKGGENMTDYVMTCSRCGKFGQIIWARKLFNWE